MMLPEAKFAVRIHQSGQTYESLKEVWTAADRLGYYSATLYDLLNAPALECWTTLAALAAVTESIRLTPLVLANAYRPAPLLAKMSATLDVISGGRLELGIGAGGGRDDHLASGVPFPSTATRVAMLEEGLQVIKRLWVDPRVSFQGSFYTLENAVNDPKPIQQPHPPILIGGHGETHLLRAAAGFADICNIGFEMSLEEHHAKLRILPAHCREVGRDPVEIEVTHNTRVVIAQSQREYRQLVSEQAARSNVTAEAYEESLARAIHGGPDQCTEQIMGYVNQGISYFFLLFPEPTSVTDLALFAREVMPNFRTALN